MAQELKKWMQKKKKKEFKIALMTSFHSGAAMARILWGCKCLSPLALGNIGTF